MINRKGLTKFTEYIIAIIVIIPVLLVVLYIFVFGVGSIKAQVQSVQAYVTQTMTALTTGTSVVLPGLSPVLSSNDFMAQFYGSPACIDLLNQLARVGLLQSPNQPSTLSDQYFMCIGSYSTSFSINGIGQSNWPNLPTNPDNASFPNWLPAYQRLNSYTSINSSGVSGQAGTLSFFEDVVDPAAALGSFCASFFNASVILNGVLYGPDTPAGYITSLSCDSYSNNGKPVFVSVNPPSGCGSSCADNPLAVLHGDNVGFDLQTCSFQGGSSLVCSEEVS